MGVGHHIGETEKKTEEIITKSHGGVLFVDEAYRLYVKDSEKDVGKEAINCLMKAMTVKGKVIILAGYPDEMDAFISVNPGIKRRITYEFLFDDYSVDDLVKIFDLQVKRRGFKLDHSLSQDASFSKVKALIETHTTPKQRSAFNGGLCEHLARQAIVNLNKTEKCR